MLSKSSRDKTIPKSLAIEVSFNTNLVVKGPCCARQSQLGTHFAVMNGTQILTPDPSNSSPESQSAKMDGVTEAQGDLASYVFPDHKLKRVMDDASKTPLLLIACGSFSPITYLHLRMFEMAADYARFKTNYEFVGGILSPVSDAYKKAGLASAKHRYTILQNSFRMLLLRFCLDYECAKLRLIKLPTG